MKLHRNAALSWSGRRRLAERVVVVTGSTDAWLGRPVLSAVSPHSIKAG